MKKLKKISGIIMLIAFVTVALLNQRVYASNAGNLFQEVEYSQDYLKWLELPDEERQRVIQPRMYNIESTDTISKSPFYRVKLLGASAISRYSLKDIIPYNLDIRNQQTTNGCWTFAALSSLETNLALSDYKKGITTPKKYDYSERHMEYTTSKTFANNVQNPIGYNREVGSGGQWYLAESYLTNGSGAISEAQMEFENNENTIDISEIQNKTVSSEVYDTIDFANYNKQTATQKAETMAQIKQHIQNYGSVFAAVHGNSSSTSAFKCYNNTTGAKYCNSEVLHNADHAISIIGWNDNYDISNFPSEAQPSSKGAWIVRNSWGEKQEYKLSDLKTLIFTTYKAQCIAQGWNSASEIPNSYIETAGYTISGDTAYMKMGDNGLIYVSYEDCNISKYLSGIIKATDTVNYDNIYQYDIYYPGKLTSFTNPNIILCNNFNKKTTGTEYITQVSLYVPETYTCRVYVNPNGTSKTKNDLQLVQLAAGESETFNSGYHTLEFAKPVKINANTFAVAIEIQGTRTNGVKIQLESKLEMNSAFNSVTVEDGKCFLASSHDLDTCTWYDLSKLSTLNSTLVDGDSSIKAFTISNYVDNALKNIEIVTPPTKTSYIEGESFNKAGMVVKANYNNNTSKILGDSEYTITNGTKLPASQSSVTIKYEDKTVNQTITVEKNNVIELKVKNAPTKTNYYEGENFDKTGMIVEAIYKDGTTKNITDFKIEDGNNLKNNQTEVNISYAGVKIKQNITVIPNSLVEIKVNKAPNKTQYVVGDNFNVTGMIVVGIYQNGLTQEIKDYTLENDKNLVKGQTSVTIKYEGKTTVQSITVEEKAQNSNLDNAKCDITAMQAYFDASNVVDLQKNYVLINIDIKNISRNLNNDSVQYYYYLSSRQNEQNITKWTKITEKQTADNKLEFTIDSREIQNYSEVSNSDVVYLYVKEVATKGQSESSKISKPMKLEIETSIETYVANKNNSNLVDTTIADKKIPQAGATLTVITLIFITSIVGVFAYIKYRKLYRDIK